MLYTWDETCKVEFLPDAAFKEISVDLRILIEEDTEAAMGVVIEHEQFVREKVFEEKMKVIINQGHT